jgi:hypothetical protein
VPLRLIALLLLLAVLPTVEGTEQVAHVVEHALAAEAPDHPAHHDDTQSDEHGCTGLVHLCGCHHTQATVTVAVLGTPGAETVVFVAAGLPPRLVDLNAPEPPHRPPIG